MSTSCHEQAGSITRLGIIVQGIDSGTTAFWLPGGAAIIFGIAGSRSLWRRLLSD